MDELQTMPLRFRVWDKENQQFCRERLPGDVIKIEFDIFDLPLEIYELDEEEADNFIISQDTGFKDKNGESIFTGDIFRSSRGLDYLVSYRRGSIYFDILGRNIDWGKKFKCVEGEIAGNIFENPKRGIRG